MARYGGYRIPEHYDPNWEKRDMCEIYQWWHLGYEDGVSQTKWDYGIHDPDETEPKQGISEFDRLKQENEALRNLLSANVRVMKAEIKKEMLEEENKE